jgi:hypothetical protein
MRHIGVSVNEVLPVKNVCQFNLICTKFIENNEFKMLIVTNCKFNILFQFSNLKHVVIFSIETIRFYG